MLIFSIPAVQSRLGKIATDFVNKEFGTNIVVKKIDLSLLGSVQLKEIEIRDHHKDTLIFVNNLKTSLQNVKKVVDNNVDLGDVTLSGAYFYMKKYKGEEDDNLSIFVKSFDDGNDQPSKNPFILKTSNIYVDDLTYKLIDEAKKEPLQFGAYNVGGNLQNFLLEGPDFSSNIKGMYLTDNRGISITNLSTDFAYTKQHMLFNNTTLETNNNSNIQADIEFTYKRKDFVSFVDKVKVTSKFKKSSVSVMDLNKLYGEIGGTDMLFFTGKMNGVLNNFSLNNVNLYSKNGIRIVGDMGFVNALNTSRGFVFDADLDKVSAEYNQLKSILPNVLGKTLPTDFKKLGRFNMSGLVKVTPEQMDATLRVTSQIGTTVSDLLITGIDDINNAEYSGEIEFINLDIGVLANDDNLGKVSLRADVDGQGFDVANINTSVIGTVSSIEFNNYTYKDLLVNGEFQNKLFDGYLEAKDDNFSLTFKGLADFSSEVHKFDFQADIDMLDLNKTQLFTRDSIALLKGKINLDISGNTFDDIVGKATFQNLEYTNQKQKYEFKKFEVNSSVKDSIKTIEVNSKDIAEGKGN